MDENYSMLAAAIIERALLDYRAAQENIRKKYAVAESERMIHDVERFLRSEWFGLLSDMNGEELLAMMRRETA